MLRSFNLCCHLSSIPAVQIHQLIHLLLVQGFSIRLDHKLLTTSIYKLISSDVLFVIIVIIARFQFQYLFKTDLLLFVV
jgi:hypothetical protein